MAKANEIYENINVSKYKFLMTDTVDMSILIHKMTHECYQNKKYFISSHYLGYFKNILLKIE